MGYNVNKMKARAEELAEGYQDARDQAFFDEFRDEFYQCNEVLNGVQIYQLIFISEDDVQGFLDSFTFDSEEEWCYNMVQSELDDIGDQKHEEERDRRMGL